MTKPISDQSDWTFDLIAAYDREIACSAERFQLDTYPNQIEIISSEQMMDAYASIGMPVGYNHWSFGKRFVETETTYRRGHMGLAYEIVINSDPCIAYLMEENTMTMQALVIAHASYGHNSFFKNNYLFKTWTDASSIIDYLVFARGYIKACEERYGLSETEACLDSCHALMNYGVDRYKRPSAMSAEQERLRLERQAQYRQEQVNDLWRTVPGNKGGAADGHEGHFPPEPQENLLYFFEKHAPNLEPWQREIARIVRKLAQYFYPQRQTKVMNEGWATFWHYTLLQDLYDRGLVTDGFMLEFLASHTGAVYQPTFDNPYFSGINPYALGFAMMRDIRRICENPTEEDKTWFPDMAGSPWLPAIHHAMENFKDESFILQYLSPHVMRDFHLFAIVDDDEEPDILVDAIHDDAGYRRVRELLAKQHSQAYSEPVLQVQHADTRGDRSLTLWHVATDRRPLDRDTDEVLRHVHSLWQFDVMLETVVDDIVTETRSCPPGAAAGGDRASNWRHAAFTN